MSKDGAAATVAFPKPMPRGDSETTLQPVTDLSAFTRQAMAARPEAPVRIAFLG